MCDLDFLPIWEFSRRFYKIDNPKSHFPERRCENQTSAGGAKYISLRIFCLSFWVQKSSWSCCTIDFLDSFEWFRFFWQTMAFKLGGYLSRAATKACLLNRTATIQPTMPLALDIQKFEKKSVFLFFFSSSWFPETSGYFLPSLPSKIRVPLGEQSILMKC